MGDTTLISVYAVDDEGRTGDYLGAGSLLDHLLVLVHPPLNEQLAGHCRDLRVAITHPARSLVELIDVESVHTSDDDGSPPVVGLHLARYSQVEPVSIDLGETEEAALRTLRAYLATVPAAPPPEDGPSTAGPRMEIICLLRPRRPGC